MSEAAKRRWFQFRLRTLLVTVALVGCAMAWIASNLNWVRERRSFLAAYQAKPPTPSRIIVRGGFRPPQPKATTSPRLDGHAYRGVVLWMFGEPEHAWLRFNYPTVAPGGDVIERTQVVIDRGGELFPEATITWWMIPARKIRKQRRAPAITARAGE
jgi:hypothetical protein